ncbi:MAG: hypothetical protein HQK52_00980 [Oligoflexia bacterium]|nr:hypothetical protein [Oligoflexia bacterium]
MNIPLSELFKGEVFYQNRFDSRYDLQAASFVEFILTKYGKNSLRKAFAQYEPPSDANPICDMNIFLRSTFGETLLCLEDGWKQYLNAFDAKSEELMKVRPILIPLVIPKSKRCAFCYSPIREERDDCNFCNNKLVSVKYLF